MGWDEWEERANEGKEREQMKERREREREMVSDVDPGVARNPKEG